MKHALVIGGTGMLKGTSIWLNRQGYHLSVLARGQERLKELEEALTFPEHFSTLTFDYTQDDTLRSELQAIQDKHGPIQIVVSWISSPAPQALRSIIDVVDQENIGTWDLYHVLGSRSDLEQVKLAVGAPATCNYRQVKLGFVVEGTQSRWLTHEEIADGVIRGISTQNPITVVGTLEPWEMRP